MGGLVLMPRVEVCGGIASGKTTLAKLLEQSGGLGSYEDFRKNPFWEMFYEDPAAYSFETEVTFLLQHYNQAKQSCLDDGLLVMDTSLVLDLAYADVNLGGPYRAAFDGVFNVASAEVGPPALLVHLLCPSETELSRIRARDRSEERSIDTVYLTAVNNAVADRVREYSLKADVLVLDSDALDFANDEETRQSVAKQIFERLQNLGVT